MQIQPLEPFTLEDVATGQFFVRSNTIKMSAAHNVIPYIDIDFVLRGNWKTTYTFLKAEGNERFCHCVTLLHEDHQLEDGLLHSEPYLVDGQKTFLFRRDQPTRFYDSHYVSVEGMMALNEDILHIKSNTFSGVFTGGFVFSTFGQGKSLMSLLVSRDERRQIYMIQLVLPMPERFLHHECPPITRVTPEDYVVAINVAPQWKEIDPMQMTHLMKVVESEGWSIEQEETSAFRIGKFSPAGQDFSIIVHGDNDPELARSICDAYSAFDPSAEAYAWLDSDGHGKNGAPYDMIDVVRDMMHCKDEIYRLYQAVTHR